MLLLSSRCHLQYHSVQSMYPLVTLSYYKTTGILNVSKHFMNSIMNISTHAIVIPKNFYYTMLCIYKSLACPVLCSVLFFFWNRFWNAKSDPKFGQRGVVLVIPMAGRKSPGPPFLLTSVWERTSGTAFWHKNTWLCYGNEAWTIKED
jgi:hypothetical protein